MSSTVGGSFASRAAQVALHSHEAVSASCASSMCQRRYLAVCSGALLFSGLIYWRYNVSIRSTLLQSEIRMKNRVVTGLQESRAQLKSMQSIWEADMRERNDQIRALQLQNVEQTRSVARLDGAMKSCLIS